MGFKAKLIAIFIFYLADESAMKDDISIVIMEDGTVSYSPVIDSEKSCESLLVFGQENNSRINAGIEHLGVDCVVCRRKLRLVEASKSFVIFIN